MKKGYEVHGIIRRSSSPNTERIDHIFQDPHVENRTLFLHYGDTTDASSLYKLMGKIQPTEVYHLGAQSHVRISFDVPDYTANVDGLGTLRMLDALINVCPAAKFYNAATSELFGKVQEIPQKETTPFYPRSPYGVAKLYGYWITRNYRESYNVFACNGILFNHESQRRGVNFVSRKITMAAANIVCGKQDRLYLGNLNAKRDWGYAPEYVEGMWLMLQQDTPDDYILATGECHTVEEFCLSSFETAGMPLTFTGEGAERVGLDASGNIRVSVDPAYYRPAEVDLLLGDPTKARKKLGWEARTKFADLAKLMTKADMVELCK